MKKKILVMAGYYTPSVKGGGPIQSIKNLVNKFSDSLDFYIMAADRDLGDKEPFEKIKSNEWSSVGEAQVFYTDYSKLTWKKVKEVMISMNFDVIYLNSFFSYKDSIIPILLLKLNKVPNLNIIVAPRGQFSSGALGLKKDKKIMYINFAKKMGLYKDIIWHATADTEKKDIQKNFGEKANIIVANNLTGDYKNLKYEKTITKNIGELKIVFVSRIHPKKNLKQAIELLKNVVGKVDFNIYGPLEDINYWHECEQEIKKLPQNIKVSYKGLVNHEHIMNIFKENHVFLFPTLGENFGHVISEALIGGCPVIISDQTPWLDLEENKVGWAIDLKNDEKFSMVLQKCVDYDNSSYEIISKKAFMYGKNKSNTLVSIKDYEKLFNII